MKIHNKWYNFLLKKVNLSATKEIRRLFPQSKFVVISQKKNSKKMVREIAFTLGPYLLCTATNVITLNNTAREWIDSHAEKPLGQFIVEKNLKVDKKTLKKGSNYRKYSFSGDINSVITEKFYEVQEIKVGAFCAEVLNTVQDEKKAYEFTKKNKCELYLFPEAYPYSRRAIDRKFPPGTVFGRYSTNGPEMYFTANNKRVKIHKSTLFANEKSLTNKVIKPTILNHNNIKIALIVCYDLLNPKISYELSKSKIDIIMIGAMIPEKDLQKWSNFVYARGTENQCSVVLCSGRDKRKITNQMIIHYDPIQEKVNIYKSPKVLSINIGGRLLYSPDVHWSILLKNEVYGPFVEDY